MKKILSILLAAIMLMGIGTTAFAASGPEETKTLGDFKASPYTLTLKFDRTTTTTKSGEIYDDEWRVGEAIKDSDLYCAGRTVGSDGKTTITFRMRNQKQTSGSPTIYIAKYGYNSVTKTKTIKEVYELDCKIVVSGSESNSKPVVTFVYGSGFVLDESDPCAINEQHFYSAHLSNLNSKTIKEIISKGTTYGYSSVNKYVSKGKLLPAVKAGNPSGMVSIPWSQYIGDINTAVLYSKSGIIKTIISSINSQSHVYEAGSVTEMSVILRKDSNTRWYAGQYNGKKDSNGNPISYKGENKSVWLRKTETSNGVKYDLVKTNNGSTSVAFGLYEKVGSEYRIKGAVVFDVTIDANGTRVWAPLFWMFNDGELGYDSQPEMEFDEDLKFASVSYEKKIIPEHMTISFIFTETFEEFCARYGLSLSYKA